MLITVILGFIAIGCLAVFIWWKRGKKSEFVQHSISAEELRDVIHSGRKVLLFDVRQPLDLLAYPEIIPGAQRVPPEEVLEKPSLIPKDKDVVVYCTCPSDKTSRMILGRALVLGFSRIKFLKGGLTAWKGMGFPVEPYTGTLAFSAATRALPKT